MCTRCPDLPFLPGYTFNPNLGRTKYNMDPKFDFIAKGVPALKEKVKPNMLGPLTDKYPSVYPRGEVVEIPAWIAYDKQILCFDAFFKEAIQEVRGAAYQVRNVKIYYFLEDGTIQVIEPKVENSGLAQGTLICRHRIRFPVPMDDNFYEMLDLNVGREVEFYGRVFKITACDIFTRTFLNRCGINVPDAGHSPPDPHQEQRLRETAIRHKQGPKKEVPFKKFLEYDQKVLHFHGYWDDTKTTYGYLHRLEILYYLSDDTIEIKEEMNESCTKTSTFTFLHRAKLPKTDRDLPGPGAGASVTVLNVLGSGLGAGRYLVDPLNCGQEAVEYYTPKDLFIGSIVNCYGRKLVLSNCDTFTREYYRTKFGLDNFEPLQVPESAQDAVPMTKTERELPPWNGYGSFEDSAQNCITVVPKAPHKDFKKFLNLDRVGLDSHILRFEARMISKIPENCTREFIIHYFLADDTIGVFECGRKNSGFASKMFFAKREMALPGQEYFTSTPPVLYTSKDMFVGAALTINSFNFVLINADEYALRYMELNAQQYPKANIQVIMSKIREKVRETYKDFLALNMPKEGNTISYNNLKAKLTEILEGDFTEHEMITIARAFPQLLPLEDKYNRQEIRAITLTELKRFLWDDMERLREYFVMRDPGKTGSLPKHDCYTIIRACRLPLEKELVEKILNVIPKDDLSNLLYEDLLAFLNREVCTLPDTNPLSIKHELSCVEVPEYKVSTEIDWCAFNTYLDLEDMFKVKTDRFSQLKKQ